MTDDSNDILLERISGLIYNAEKSATHGFDKLEVLSENKFLKLKLWLLGTVIVIISIVLTIIGVCS